MKLILQPVKLNKKCKFESVKTAKFIHVGKEKILINNIRLDEVAKAYFLMRQEEITKDKIKDFIANF